MKLIQPYCHQGYEVYFDNFYTSPVLLEELLRNEVVATGTLNVTRKGVPKDVVAVKNYVDKLSRRSGYYFRPRNSKVTYCSRHDTKTVALASTAYPAHSKNTVSRRVKDPLTNTSTTMNVPCPVMLEKYNKSMGGVDKSDQLISYHRLLRKTVKYWKAAFFHLLDVAIVNAHILYNWFQLQNAEKPITENQFRDLLVLKIISTYGKQRCLISSNYRKLPLFKIYHGSKIYPLEEKSLCVYCKLHNSRSATQCKCPDCPLNPALCQTVEKDCHSEWHSDAFSMIRKLWYEKHLKPVTRNRKTTFIWTWPPERKHQST